MQTMQPRPFWILPVIVVAQFACGSLWFSANAILPELIAEWSLSHHAVGYLTSAVQFGFIIGTFLFAWFAISDRYSPVKVFFVCSVFGAIANSLILLFPAQLALLIAVRFTTGFFLAGIYPVGMKIAAGWYRGGLGRALGLLVGALVLGTAFPHMLKAAGLRLDWQAVLIATSCLSVSGGLAVRLLVLDGPYSVPGASFDFRTLFSLFAKKEIRAAAFGYFGHMWELYTLWAFVPFFLTGYLAANIDANFNIPLCTFLIIASGAIGCVAGGLIAKRFGSGSVATFLLAVSGSCCLLSPLFFNLSPVPFLLVMLIWGIAVAGDSPQYSAIIALQASGGRVGSILTLVNCIGFFITIVSIQCVDLLSRTVPVDKLLLILLPGPVLGVYAMRRILKVAAD